MAKKSQKITIKKTKTKKVAKERELTRLGSALRTLGGLGGGALGGLIGMPSAGSSAGTGLGAALSKWLGSGDYQVQSNTLVNSLKASGSIPAMHREGQTITVRHREFLGEVLSSTSFTTRMELPINPGMSSTFPWLSGIASKFQQYRVKGMVFHYVPTSGNAVSSTNNALGSVILQTSYRANDSGPISKIEALNEYWSTEVVPSETVAHPIECNPNENPFNVQYVRAGSLSSTDSILMYDLGRTFVCVSGQQANGVVLGDMWVTYEIELKKPILDSPATSLAQKRILQYESPSPSNLFGSGVPSKTEGLLDITTNNFRAVYLNSGVSGTFTIRVDVYIGLTGTVAGAGMSGAPSVTDCEVLDYISGINRVETTTTSATDITRLTYAVKVRKRNSFVRAQVDMPTYVGLNGQYVLLTVYRDED